MNKPNFVLSGIAAIALMASCGSEPPPPPPGTHVNPVDFIPRDSANKMINSYLNSISANANDTNLHSICINMDQLRLYDERSQGPGRIQHLKLFLAHKLDYVNAGNEGRPCGYSSNALTVVIAGYTANGSYVYLEGDKVLDHSTPCPHNCPPGQASSDLLQ